jgi:predicted dehydrogenase
MKVGAIIGFGNIAEHGHWPTYETESDVEIVAVVEPSPARQAAARANKADLRLYSTVQELFANEQIDFIDVCTPPASHADLALQALGRGIHVLCEKPLTLKQAEYEQLAAAQRSSGKTVFTVHNWKHAPIYQKAFEWLRAGRIGPVWHVELFVLRDSHCKGAATDSSSSLDPAEDWRTNPNIAGGGVLVDHGWHAFYLLLNLVGAEPQSVLSKLLRSDDQSLEEAAQTLVQFPGADAYIHLTWRAPMRKNSALIQGLEGTLLIDDDRLLLTTLAGGREEMRFASALSTGSYHADWFKSFWPSFVEELSSEERRGENFYEAGWCLALTSAAYDSHARGSQDVPLHAPQRLRFLEARP